METNTNIHLIDASRTSSEEGLINEQNINNKWTNKISDGLKLNAGDKVSVAYSSINEIGCGDSALETTGKFLNTTVEYTYTNVSNNRNPTSDAGLNLEFGPYGVETVIAKNKILKKKVKDNEFNVVVSYYKNTNGENYVHLPRAFDSGIDPLGEAVDYNELGTSNGMGPNGWGNRDDERKKVWFQGDDLLNGRPDAPLIRSMSDWHWYRGCQSYVPKSNPLNLGLEAYLATDIARGEQYYDINIWKQKNDNSRYTLYQMEKTYYHTSDADLLDTTVKNRNNIDVVLPATEVRFDYEYGERDIPLTKFHKYQEIKQYEVDVGFNDPHNVAFKLSSQLSDPLGGVEPYFTHQVGYKASEPASVQPVPDYDAAITQNQKGETFKPFAAANWKTLRRGNPIDQAAGDPSTLTTGAWANFYNSHLYNVQTATSTGSAPEQAAQKLAKQQDVLDYLSSYNMIGVKRPELWDTGRDLLFSDTSLYPEVKDGDDVLYKAGEPNLNDANGNTAHYQAYTSALDGRNMDYLKTTFPWKEETLQALKKYFEAQKLYPELIDFPRRDTDTNQTYNTTLYKMDTPPVQPSLMTNEGTETEGIDDPMYKRFLHINQKDTTDYGSGGLGFDHSGLAVADYNTAYQDQVDKDDESVPFFFYYDPANAETYIDSNIITNPGPDWVVGAFDYHRPTDLCYGFAKKWYVGDDTTTDPYIALSVQGLPQELFPDAEAVSDRALGHDWHFNAYGTSAICLYSGWLPNDPLNNCYVGLGSQGQEQDTTPPKFISGGGPTMGGQSGITGHQANYRTSVIGPAEGYGISALLRQIYVGAIDPSITFSSDNSRFQIMGLHTPEWIQNPPDAGKPDATNTATGIIDPLPDAGTEVYKINKKIIEWNNYTPEMCPFRETSSFTAPLYESGDHNWKVEGSGYEFTVIVDAQGELEAQDGGTSYNTIGGYILKGQEAEKPNNADTAVEGHWNGPSQTNGYFGSNEGGGVDKLITGNTDVRPISDKATYLETNQNLDNFVVYDGHGGIYLEDFGINNEEDWYDSLFGIMGWSWKQMNPDKISSATQLNRQTRLTRVNYSSMKPLTTSADIPLKDVPTNIKNLWQKPIYTCQVPAPLISNLWFGYTFAAWAQTAYIFDGAPSGANWGLRAEAKTWGEPEPYGYKIGFMNGDLSQLQVYPMTVNPAISQSINADGLPIKMKNPYYLVKSNIIADSFYLKDKTPMPIVAVVNKENGFGDFYFSQESQMIFTITNPITISEILTEIYNADMTPARCDRHSGIIYKIEKSIPINPDLVQQLLTLNKDIGLVQKKKVEGNMGPDPPITKKDFQR
tara:strand:- start:92 stop:4045 length:3954 start_codon:yes stop_codon:yes gene_type:complete